METIPETTEYATLYIKSNSPIASNCNSDQEDESDGSAAAHKQYKKYTYENILNSLSKYYDENDKSGSELDVLLTYLRGSQLLYKQSEHITNIKNYLLLMSTLGLSIILSIITPYIRYSESGMYFTVTGNALIAGLILLSRFLNFGSRITNYSLMHQQINRLENMIEIAPNETDTEVVAIQLNFGKTYNLQEAEFRLNEMKEYQNVLVPESIIRLFPLIHNINIFRFIKKMEQYKHNLIIRFRDIKNEIHFILHKWNPQDDISDEIKWNNSDIDIHENKNDKKDISFTREHNRVLFLMELKEKVKGELIQCKNTYIQIDELLNSEIRYAETHQSCFGCAGWFRPEYDFSKLTPPLREYLKLVIPD
jgi:hypothetical protein